MDGGDRDYERARTQRSNLAYQMTSKHHRSNSTSEEAQWRGSLTDDEEFLVFDLADLHALESFPDGDLFGVLPNEEGELLEIGSRDEQLAKFPVQPVAMRWHGYPMRCEYKNDPRGPDRQVWSRLVAAGLATEEQVMRLKRGQNA